MLPQQFQNRMQEMLKEEYPAFLKSYECTKKQSLRVNLLKADKEEFVKSAPFHLQPVPWSPDGFYYEPEDQPGKHPLHEAGVYYIQEPSAMLPAVLLEAKPGERVLDLCAAPGGKSTQIAADMQGRGILICNEIHPARAKILSENIERMGICNAIVLNETPERLADRFAGWFDRIMVDAPCSGEGMFRKNEEACSEWSEENVRLCAERQDAILDCAAVMLRTGGRLVYSTCTFAPEENEGSISRLMVRHPEFTLLETEKVDGMSGGVAEWTAQPAEHLERAIRLWPHKLRGEGHFAAVLIKGKEDECQIPAERKTVKKGADMQEFEEFCKDTLRMGADGLRERTADGSGEFVSFGEQLYLTPGEMPSLDRLKVLRPGLHLGTFKKGRFEPSHALALFLKAEDVYRTWNLSTEDGTVRSYLNGQTFPAEGEKGWYLITVDGYSLGWGKFAGGIMKNHYPKGLRKG